ncbi:MAG: hypothetical protein IR159_02390, partial [Brevundimonas sp.]|nr:hypothetical protein [Brevundimonas sp.]
MAALLVISGCAPTGAGAPPGAEASARRCFSSSGIRLIKFEPGDGVYVRTRTGEALQLTGPAACLDVTNDASIGLRAFGLDGADICLGDPAHLDIRSHAAILRTCNVEVSRTVPQAEVA